MMEAVRNFETVNLYQSAGRYNPEDGHLDITISLSTGVFM
jgi:hypothetical protein